MAKFAIGDKVHQASSNHAEGTVVAIFTDRAGERRYAVEMFGHRTIQIGNEGNLVAHTAARRLTASTRERNNRGQAARAAATRSAASLRTTLMPDDVAIARR
jgi:hypothetical protein